MVNRHKVLSAAGMFAILVMLAGCGDDQPANQVTLDVAEIKGIGFNEPLPQEAAEDETTAAPSITADSGPAAPELTASADDIPEDIAMIPSATPVPPTPTPGPTPVPDASEMADTSALEGEFKPVPFKVLTSYKYVEPIPQEGEKPEEVEKRRESDQIPDNIKALDGSKAMVEGWMVPMEIADDGSVRSFVLVNMQPECCFGDMQAMNEWVDVMMKPGANAEFNVDMPVKVYGNLEVGEKTEDGFVLSIYRMKADRVEL